MRPWQSSKIAVGAPATPLVTNAETVLATLGGISTQSADSVVILEAVVQVLWGTTANAATIRIRRGTDITGQAIGQNTVEDIIAGKISDLELQVTDAPGELAGGSYVVTVQQASATANGTFQQGSLQATF